MLRLVAGRLIGGVLLILLLTLITYVVFFRVPVDPVIYIAPEATGDQRTEIRRLLGLDEPLVEQWGRFVWRLGTDADLGTALIGGRPVNSYLKSALPPTVSLVLGGFALTLLLALPLGTLAALRPRSVLDRSVLAFAVLGIVLHPFVVGLLLREVLADRFGLAPASGYCPLRGSIEVFTPFESTSSSCGGFADWAHHMWLPWLTFAIFFLPLYTRMVRARALDNLRQTYVVTARAKGASETRVVTRHLAQNALGPVAAMLAVDIATIITAAIYVETVFGLPGIGRLVVANLSGNQGYDLHVLLGVVVVVAIAITIVNLLADVTVRALDPRVRVGRAGG